MTVSTAVVRVIRTLRQGTTVADYLLDRFVALTSTIFHRFPEVFDPCRKSTLNSSCISFISSCLELSE